MADPLIIVRGAGDIASGTIHRLHCAGFRLLALETAAPLAIRRTVSFAEAVYAGSQTVEEVTARLAPDLKALAAIWQGGEIPLLVDPQATAIGLLRPFAVIDAILAKKNLGTHRAMAPLTIGLGPGFYAGSDVHVVIETARGHNLGRLIHAGSASANTGVPGEIGGYTSERVLYADRDGILSIIRDIGSTVACQETIATIDGHPVKAKIGGTVRGMLRGGIHVTQCCKLADIDPRPTCLTAWSTISDKARCISGSVLEAVVSQAKKAGTDTISFPGPKTVY